MLKALIFNPFGIGDVLFSMPLVRNLKENIKDILITYICNKRVYQLLKKNIFLENVIVFEKDDYREYLKKSKILFLKRLFGFFNSLKKEKFDLVFDLSLNSQYGFFLKLLGIKMRIGYDFKNRGRFLTHKIKLVEGYNKKHVARYYLDLLKFLNINPKEYNFDIFLQEEELKRQKILLNEFSYNDFLVGVFPGSGDSWGENSYFKRWPEENFVKLCNYLQDELNANIILLGSESEKSLCDYVSFNLNKKCLNLCGKLNLNELIHLLSLVKLVITNDGGPFHIAQALRKKTIVFFGPVDDNVYGKYLDLDNIFVFKKDIPCRPCYKNFKFKGCVYDKKCLKEISANEVISVLRELIF